MRLQLYRIFGRAGTPLRVIVLLQEKIFCDGNLSGHLSQLRFYENLHIIFITYQGWKHDLLRGLSGSEKALAQAKNLRHVNDWLGVVFFVREQYEKSEDVWHDLLGIRNLAVLHQLHLLDDKADENLVRVQQAIIDSELYELNEQLKNLIWRKEECLDKLG